MARGGCPAYTRTVIINSYAESKVFVNLTKDDIKRTAENEVARPAA